MALLNVYPNPAADEARLIFTSAINDERYQIRVLNDAGIQLNHMEGTIVQGQNTIEMHVGIILPEFITFRCLPCPAGKL